MSGDLNESRRAAWREESERVIGIDMQCSDESLLQNGEKDGRNQYRPKHKRGRGVAT